MLNQEQIQANKEKFISLVKTAGELNEKKKEGLERLLQWLDTTDFYTSPASTVYHQNYDGGLCEHVLSVYDHLEKLVKDYGYEDKISDYSRIITALFHDFCKIGRYEKTYKTVPRKDEKGVEIKDANGKLIWEKQEVISYKQDPGVILGHSAKSVYLIQFFISLTGEEAEAIYSHMGPFDLSEYFTRKDLSAIYSRNKLAYLLHISDMNDLYL